MYECRFPKLAVRTQPQMLKAVDVSPPRRKRPIPIPKLECDQLTPNLVCFLPLCMYAYVINILGLFVNQKSADLWFRSNCPCPYLHYKLRNISPAWPMVRSATRRNLSNCRSK